MTSAEVAKKIPVLTGAQMYKGSFTDPDNKNAHCLLGHQQHLPNFELATAMYQTLRRMIKLRKHSVKFAKFGEIPIFNDREGLSLDELAAFWNQARRRVIQSYWRKERTRVAKAVRASLKG